jgi:hypothetical protein
MLKFYTNRDLSRGLKINLAKWKRWSRDFLPPDPLGGLQSGYARQYNPDEAFKVFMGGYLVGELKFTIPEARQILQDLHAWLVEYGFYFGISDAARTDKKDTLGVKSFIIRIIPKKSQNNPNYIFSYKIQGIISEREILFEDRPGSEVVSFEWVINKPGTDMNWNKWLGCRLICISELRAVFLNNLQSESPAE